MSKPHFSSLRMDWRTPKAVYQVLDAEFNIHENGELLEAKDE